MFTSASSKTNCCQQTHAMMQTRKYTVQDNLASSADEATFIDTEYMHMQAKAQRIEGHQSDQLDLFSIYVDAHQSHQVSSLHCIACLTLISRGHCIHCDDDVMARYMTGVLHAGKCNGAVQDPASSAKAKHRHSTFATCS